MLQSATATQSNNHYFNFIDVDDTILDLKSFFIKNPHYLLPIMLFQTKSKNHDMAILTNRTPRDDMVEFSVSNLVNLLQTFGIVFPHDQVIFCGGDIQHQTEQRSLQEAIFIISNQVASLNLTDASNSLATKLNDFKGLAALVDKTKYSGKNYHILKFLNARIKSETQVYQFHKGPCPKDNLTIVLIDDNENIASAVNQLGAKFVGVQATRGGNFLAGDNESDYYSIKYLQHFANIIGFADYAISVLTRPKNHKQDCPMMRIAALLYCWQTCPDKVQVSDFNLPVEQLSEDEFAHFYAMLKYIHHHSKSHPDSCFIEVAPLLSEFLKRAELNFILLAPRQMQIIDKALASLDEQLKPTVAEPNERPKTKTGLSGLFTRKSASAKSLNVTVESAENEKRRSELVSEKQALLSSLEAFTKSDDPEISRTAKSALAAIRSPMLSNFSQESEVPASVSSESASTSSEMDRSRNFLPSVSHSTQSTTKAITSTVTNEDSKKKKSGSNLYF